MNYRDKLYWIMIIAVFSLVAFLFFNINSESSKCISNPLVYGVSQYVTNRGEFSCRCSVPMAEESLYVTKDNITVVSNYFSITP